MKRRDFILGSAAVGSSVAAQVRIASAAHGGQSKRPTAEEVLEALIAGNRRFVSGRSMHPHMTEDWLERLTHGQQPIATILACSDSRVPLELLFDMGFGDLFSIRVAGNVVTRYGIGSMEYAQHHLQTPLFMVLGHEGCGAVTAAMLPQDQREKEPKGVRQLLDLVTVGRVDRHADAKAQLAAAVEANVRNSSKQLRQLDPQTEGFQIQKGNMLVSAVYELSTGRVRILERYRDKHS